MPVKHLIGRGIGFSPGSVKYIVTLGLSIGAGGGVSGLVKKIFLGWHKSDAAFYVVIRRETDGYFLNDADGAFASGPSDPYLALTENGTLKGLYEVTESRAIWNDGYYMIAVYEQAGGSPSLTVDTMVMLSQVKTVADAITGITVHIAPLPLSEIEASTVLAKEATVQSILTESQSHPTLAEMESSTLAKQANLDFIQKWILNRLVKTVNGTTETWVLYNDNNTAVLNTWTWDNSTNIRTKAT